MIDHSGSRKAHRVGITQNSNQMKQNEKMRDFIKSLENNQLSKEQEAMLLVSKADDLQAGNNRSCENKASSCDMSINDRRCTNGTSTGCQGSLNGRKCTKIETGTTEPPLKEP